MGGDVKDKFVVNNTAKDIYKRKFMMRLIAVIVAFLLLFLSLVYIILYVVNKTGNFTISLDPNLKSAKKIVISATSDFKETPLILETKSLSYMDNISQLWLPDDIDKHEGEHSGNNYLAYTFFVRNNGDETTSYSLSIDILSVIKNVDEAVRVMLITNGDKKVYAKVNSKTKKEEKGTIAFKNDSQIMYELVNNFKPKDVNKYTVVIWLEGDDPECVDAILGGEMKMILSLGEDKK